MPGATRTARDEARIGDRERRTARHGTVSMYARGACAI